MSFPDAQQKDEAKVISPTTPRPNPPPQSLPAPAQSIMDDATTPTRATFSNAGNGMATQKPLPRSPFPEGAMDTEEPTQQNKTHARANSSISKRSRDSDEMDVDESDNDTAGEEDGAESDGEGSVNADGTRSSKKKKGNQRFFCKGYPPCKLSFTRSEHLARHIR